MNLETAMKAFFIKQNTNSHVKKSKKTNLRKIDGECLTTNEVVDRIREHEEQLRNKEKKKPAKRKLNFQDRDEEEEMMMSLPLLKRKSVRNAK